MELAGLVAAADQVAATASRSAKRDTLAAVLRRLDPDEVEAAVGFLLGDPRQGRLGVGWATLAAAGSGAAGSVAAAGSGAAGSVGAAGSGAAGSVGAAGSGAVGSVGGAEPRGGGTNRPLVLADVDHAFALLAATHGPGSVATRRQILGDVLARASSDEVDFIRRLLVGEMRQGALEGVMADAVATAAEVPAALVRRAAMFSGDLRRTAAVALTEGRPGLEAIGLTLFQPVQPMLAGAAEDVSGALGAAGTRSSVEWKLDGARIQVHRQGDRVAVYTRNLNEVTERLPEVVDLVRALPGHDLVLDGEVLGLAGDAGDAGASRDDGDVGRGGEAPEPFQATMSRFGRDDPGSHHLRLRPFFFDVLRADGQDLIDLPLGDRLPVLDRSVGHLAVPRLVTDDPAAAEAFVAATLAAGHEGVVAKDLASPYAAGRRGKAWRKLKPVHTFDLVVLAAEWGHGRRRGWLSNLHLGARADDGSGFVMVGKTFKGLTDDLLRWQTEALAAREVATDGYVVHVAPELVVEVAVDGVQTSTRYPGGIALRFARIRRYRPDKRAADADPLSALLALRR